MAMGASGTIKAAHEVLLALGEKMASLRRSASITEVRSVEAPLL
ncbi:hypothetical protein SEEC0006_20081 [Salmonella enterica subsp. enterica serovar Choleraesuis str. 0006]|nr:hypothetical protein SEEC0006_20081 [Salmonella enterica subsp. enterica serovar Choleraesuis str. 0006]